VCIMDREKLRSSEVDRYLNSDFEYSEDSSDGSVEDIIVQHGESNRRPMEFLQFTPSPSKSKTKQSTSESRLSTRLFKDFEDNSEVGITNNGSPKPIENMDITEIPSTSTDTCTGCSMEPRPMCSTSEPNIQTNPIQNLPRPTKVLFLEKPINKKHKNQKRDRPTSKPKPKKSPTVRSSKIPTKGKTNKKPKFVDSDWPWIDIKNVPKKIEFRGVPGINVHALRCLGNNPTELDTFMQFVGDEFWDMIVTETNDYAKKLLGTPGRKRLKADSKWVDVTRDELKVYFALYVNMGQVKKPELKHYWTHRKILETPIFTETMAFERFTNISRFLHFYDENIETENQHDKLKKLRTVIRYLETKFLHMLEPEKDIALDETLLKMRSRLSIIQFNPKKRARFGVKIYKVCESSSGYCCTFKIYVGDDKTDDTLASEAVTLDLLQPFFDMGYVVYLDNWYSSPLLYEKLLEHDTYAVGTALLPRRCMPQVFKQVELKKGEAIRRSGRGVLAVKWSDNKYVHMLSTVHEDIEMEVSKIVNEGDQQVEIKKT